MNFGSNLKKKNAKKKPKYFHYCQKLNSPFFVTVETPFGEITTAVLTDD